jgi:hypothetical protein
VEAVDWQRLLPLGDSNVVFLAWWQQAWWDTYGRGRCCSPPRDAGATWWP